MCVCPPTGCRGDTRVDRWSDALSSTSVKAAHHGQRVTAPRSAASAPPPTPPPAPSPNFSRSSRRRRDSLGSRCRHAIPSRHAPSAPLSPRGPRVNGAHWGSFARATYRLARTSAPPTARTAPATASRRCCCSLPTPTARVRPRAQTKLTADGTASAGGRAASGQRTLGQRMRQRTSNQPATGTAIYIRLSLIHI